MMRVKPFRGLRPRADLTSKVASPPYDVLSSEEAGQTARTNPFSFLHIIKPEIDLPDNTDPYSDQVYHKGRENLQRFIREGILVQDDSDAVYIYRLTWRGHVQSGYFCLSSVDDYDSGRIKKHELTRAKKETDRSTLIDVMNAQVGPVLLMYRANEKLDQILETSTQSEPDVDFSADDGIRHQLWIIKDSTAIQQIEKGFAALDATYVADGHHRSAAASNVCRIRRGRNTTFTGEEPYNFFLSVIFPHDRLKILPYNRLITDLNGLDDDQFMARIKENCTVVRRAAGDSVDEEHTFGMYMKGHWYQITANPGSINPEDVLDRLDVNILMKLILKPILGITDPRTDPRIDFVGGMRGESELEKLVNSGAYKIAFSLFPTSVETLMEVADAGLIMPPKSTWFEPKLRSGMVSHLL